MASCRSAVGIASPRCARWSITSAQASRSPRRLAGVVPTAHTPAGGVERPLARIRELLDRIVHVLGRGDPQMVDEDFGVT